VAAADNPMQSVVDLRVHRNRKLLAHPPAPDTCSIRRWRPLERRNNGVAWRQEC
jgi:hypothetical protein